MEKYESLVILLTHDPQLHGVAFTISLDIRRDAGIVARLVACHALQSQITAVHDDAGLGIVLHCLTLKAEPKKNK